MLQITKPLNPFLRRSGNGYIIESKQPIAVEGVGKTGGPKNEGSSGYVTDKKGQEKRHLGLSGNVEENNGLSSCIRHNPDMFMKLHEVNSTNEGLERTSNSGICTS